MMIQTSVIQRMALLLTQTGTRQRLSATLFVLVVYLVLPTRLYFWDGVAFSINIEAPNASAISLFHPNHLVYNLIGYAVWKGLSAVGIALRVLPILQALNAFFAAATVYFLWQILKETTHSAACSTWGTLIFAFSATWWKYATDADAYILSIFFLVLTYWFVTMHPVRPLAAGLAHSTAILVHQLALFFLPVALLGIHYGCVRRQASKRQRIYTLAEYAITAVSLTAVAYVSAFVLRSQPPSDVRGFWKWITTHQDDVPFFSFDLLRNAQLTLRSIVRLFFGGRFNFVRADLVTVTVVLASCVAAGLLLLHNFRRPRGDSSLKYCSHRPRSWIEMNRLPLVWLLSYTVFLFFGRPQDTFHWLFCVPALILLIAGTSSYTMGSSKWMAFPFVALFACNFAFYTYPYSRTENNEILSFALDHQKDWPPGSVIVHSQFHSDLWTISYFNPQATWVAMPVPTMDEVNSRRSEAERNGNPIWLEARVCTAIAGLPGGREWLEKYIDQSRSLVKEKPGYKVGFYRLR
jgi:hypothetical protein